MYYINIIIYDKIIINKQSINIKIAKGVIIIIEFSLSTNNFNTPKEYEGAEAIFVLIKRLILLTPGTYQNHPYMGVGLFKKWKFTDEDNVNLLKAEIENQIETYLPQYQLSQVNISHKGEKELLISIQVQNIVYSFQTDEGELQLIDLL